MLYDLFVVLLLNVWASMTCLQHRVSVLAKHGLLFPVSFFEVCPFTLLFSIVLLPRISLRFEHLLKAITGSSNVFLVFGLRCNNSHLVLRILATGGKVRLKVVTNGIRLQFFQVFWVRVSLRGFSLAFLICFDTNIHIY